MGNNDNINTLLHKSLSFINILPFYVSGGNGGYFPGNNGGNGGYWPGSNGGYSSGTSSKKSS